MILSDIKDGRHQQKISLTTIKGLRSHSYFLKEKSRMCLTVTQPPPGLFFWNWNKNAELFNLIFFENALQAPCIPDFVHCFTHKRISYCNCMSCEMLFRAFMKDYLRRNAGAAFFNNICTIFTIFLLTEHTNELL